MNRGCRLWGRTELDTTEVMQQQEPLKTAKASLHVVLKGGPGNRGRSACGPSHVARLEFPRVILPRGVVFSFLGGDLGCRQSYGHSVGS